jgi:hypothetical protein
MLTYGSTICYTGPLFLLWKNEQRATMIFCVCYKDIAPMLHMCSFNVGSVRNKCLIIDFFCWRLRHIYILLLQTDVDLLDTAFLFATRAYSKYWSFCCMSQFFLDLQSNVARRCHILKNAAYTQKMLHLVFFFLQQWSETIHACENQTGHSYNRLIPSACLLLTLIDHKKGEGFGAHRCSALPYQKTELLCILISNWVSM